MVHVAQRQQMAMSCGKKTNFSLSLANGHDDTQICGQKINFLICSLANPLLSYLVVRKQTFCVVYLAKKAMFQVRMVKSPFSLKIIFSENRI